MAAVAAGNLDPEDQAYFDTQRQQAKDTYQIGLADNASGKSLADLTYAQKISALQDQLQQKNNALPDSYAARGLSNSGIWSYGGGTTPAAGGTQGLYSNYAGIAGSQLGADQQFKYDSALSNNDLLGQEDATNSQYAQKNADLQTADNDSTSSINATEASYNARQAASDAIAGA